MSSDLTEIRDLYRRGLYLRAYHRAESRGPLRDWRGVDEEILAGRLASRLGGRQLSTRILHRAFVRYPDHPDAMYYAVYNLLHYRGPLVAWEMLRRTNILSTWSEKQQGDWHALRAQVLGIFRDFDRAEIEMTRAFNLTPDDPWIHCERAALWQMEDRFEDALKAGRRALDLQPWSVAGVNVTAHLLQITGREDEAVSLLREAATQTESAEILTTLADLQIELGRYPEARAALDAIEPLFPLMNKRDSWWLAGRRSDAAYYCGDTAASLALAKEAGAGYYGEIVKNMERPGVSDAKRLSIRVNFIRQHHVTCAPAVLSALSAFWGMPAEHLNVADEICYGGTSSHSQRRWAQTHGWAVREFTVTWESAVALLERGVPFALETVATGTGHIQAVMGYDERRRTLLIRDPYLRQFREFLADPLFEQHQAHGPRGMAMAPMAKQDLLAGLDLPHAMLYDMECDAQEALLKHDRAGAELVYRKMVETTADHPVAIGVRSALADYDADPAARLAALEHLSRLYPGDSRVKLRRLLALRAVSRPIDLLQTLEEVSKEPHADPIFWDLLGNELSHDARQHKRAEKQVRRAIRYRGTHAPAHHTLAGLLWGQRRFDEAVELYRLATCLDNTQEAFARAYFGAARHLRQMDVALGVLQGRFERMGKQSSHPARTLAWAYNALHRDAAALAVAEQAMALRPDDGEAMLDAVEAFARTGNLRRAAQVLAHAEKHSKPAVWLRFSARLANNRGDRAEALATWRKVLTNQPLAVDAHAEVTHLLAELEGRPAAVAHITAATERFPHHHDLRVQRQSWLSDDPLAAEAAARELLALSPANAWAMRELANALGRQRRFDEARAEALRSRDIEPLSPSTHNILGHIEEMSGNRVAAAPSYRRAIELAVDSRWAINQLMGLCDSLPDSRAALDFVWNQLVEQVVYGEGLKAYYEHASRNLPHEELLINLKRVLEARPDLWHAWSVLTRHLIAIGRLDEALAQARESAGRFPLVPGAWLDVARVNKARADAPGQARAIRQALRLAPDWEQPIHSLCDLYVRRGRFAKARRLMERAVARNPMNAGYLARLADVLSRLDLTAQAVDAAGKALALNPDDDWSWRALGRWAEQLKKPQIVLELVRDLTRRRAGEVRSWLTLAQVLNGFEHFDERMAAIAKAITLEPRNGDIYNLKATLLAGRRRFDEALEACRPAVYGGALPTSLRGRAAWVEAQRGRVKQAVEAMKAVVRDEPQYQWGWIQLLDWCRSQKDKEGSLEAANALIRLSPNSPAMLTRRAGVKLWTGDRGGAKADFRRAVELAPNEGDAGYELFAMHLKDKEPAAAEDVLRLLGPHARKDVLKSCQGQVAAARHDAATAERLLRELCVDPTEEAWGLDTLVTAMYTAGWADAVVRTLDQAIALPDASPLAVAARVRRLIEFRRWGRCAKKLKQVRDRPKLWNTGAKLYVEGLAKAQRRGNLKWFIRWNRESLHENDRLWGAVGFALSTVRDNRGTIRWLSSWRGRPGLQPWMLVNLALALRRRGRWKEAEEVGDAALALAPDYTSPMHDLWKALAEVEAGKADASQQRLDRVVAQQMSNYYVGLHALIQGTVSVARRRGSPDAYAVLEAALKQIDKAGTPLAKFRSDPELLSVYRRCLRRMGRDSGSMKGRARARWRTMLSMLPRRA